MLGAHLPKGLRRPCGKEHRIVSKPPCASRRGLDDPFGRPGHLRHDAVTDFVAVGIAGVGQRQDEAKVADKARSPVDEALHLGKQLLDVLGIGGVFSRVSGRMDTRQATESLYFQSGIVGEHREGSTHALEDTLRLLPGVLFECEPRLFGHGHVWGQCPDHHVGAQNTVELRRLARVPRCQCDSQSPRVRIDRHLDLLHLTRAAGQGARMSE